MMMSSHSLQFTFLSRLLCPPFRGIRFSGNLKWISSSSPLVDFLFPSNSNPVFCGGFHRSQFRRCFAGVYQCKAASESKASAAVSLRLLTASEVVRDFYDGINRRDLESVESLISMECVYEDLIFSKPFVGRKATMEFFKKFTESISSDLQFVIDEISSEDTSSIGVTWHLEWRGRPFPFSKGCSFYRLEVSEGTRKIIYARDCVEPALKPGTAALEKVGVAPVVNKIRESFLRWFGHIKHRPTDDPIRRVDALDLPYVKKGKGRPKKTWFRCIKNDLSILELNEDLTHNMAQWRRKIHVADPT